MKYPATTKQWKKIGKEVENTLRDKSWKPVIYMGRSGFISEISFSQKTKEGGLFGFTYGCDQCSQPLLKRIAGLIPKKFVEKV